MCCFLDVDRNYLSEKLGLSNEVVGEVDGEGAPVVAVYVSSDSQSTRSELG